MKGSFNGFLLTNNCVSPLIRIRIFYFLVGFFKMPRGATHDTGCNVGFEVSDYAVLY